MDAIGLCRIYVPIGKLGGASLADVDWMGEGGEVGK